MMTSEDKVIDTDSSDEHIRALSSLVYNYLKPYKCTNSTAIVTSKFVIHARQLKNYPHQTTAKHIQAKEKPKELITSATY